jgi:hypothetical protein
MEKSVEVSFQSCAVAGLHVLEHTWRLCMHHHEIQLATARFTGLGELTVIVRSRPHTDTTEQTDTTTLLHTVSLVRGMGAA